jgi:glutamate racemase
LERQPLTTTSDKSAIGIFDSGIGGLSVWQAIVDQLPNERTYYLADQANVPYGPRPAEEIEALSHSIVHHLLEHNAKVIVIACNTASGAALESLRLNYPAVPFVGMEPAVKPAVELTRTGHIGVIATPTTFHGYLYRRLADRFGRDVAIHTQVCPGLVEAIEAGDIENPATTSLIRTCLTPLLDQDIDQLVLGCTHYPFVRETIERLSGSGVTVIDPAPAVARQVGRVLATHDITAHPNNSPTHTFCTTGNTHELQQRIAALLGYDVVAAACRWHNGRILC